jgi:hypothetical protein
VPARRRQAGTAAVGGWLVFSWVQRKPVP